MLGLRSSPARRVCQPTLTSNSCYQSTQIKHSCFNVSTEAEHPTTIFTITHSYENCDFVTPSAEMRAVLDGGLQCGLGRADPSFVAGNGDYEHHAEGAGELEALPPDQLNV